MKKCSRCGVPKKVEEFHRRRLSSDGRQPACKVCLKPIQAALNKKYKVRRARAKKEYAKKHPEINAKSVIKYLKGHPDHRIKRLYGLSSEQFEEMKKKQRGCCAICRLPEKLCVDHDHQTDEVRGLLCRKCNAAIGLLSDSSDIASQAVEYLKSHDR